jgi:hypothetical protein
MKNGIITLVLDVLYCMSTTAAIARVSENGLVATYTPPVSTGAIIDYANAKPMPIPIAHIPAISPSEVSRIPPRPVMPLRQSKELAGLGRQRQRGPDQVGVAKAIARTAGVR